jgi:hypothetical protein
MKLSEANAFAKSNSWIHVVSVERGKASQRHEAPASISNQYAHLFE